MSKLNTSHYAGIGSRETPENVVQLFINFAKFAALNGLTLRSGHADGADMAFEIGCDLVNGEKEIYLPWRGFNNSDSQLIVRTGLAYEIAESFHPHWNNLSDGAKKLHARNTHQILGWDCTSPADFVICWTRGGADIGGTAQAIRLARHLDIPVLNVGKYTSVDEMRSSIVNFLK